MLAAPRSRWVLTVALLAVVIGLNLLVGFAPEALLWMAPIALLVVPLIAGRFPGEAAIAAARRSQPTVPCRRNAKSAPTKRPVPRVSHRGRVMAHALAERGPPARALAV
jgi:hypothetical protein